MEEAYKQIANHIQNNDFSKALKALAESKDMTASELSVGDLFDISYYDCDDHDGHNGFTITLKAETLDNLVGILHLKNNTWENLQIVEWNKDAKTVTFFVETLSPFAIVVDNGSGSSTPPTGDNAMAYLGVALVAAAGLVVVLVGAKKKKA